MIERPTASAPITCNYKQAIARSFGQLAYQPVERASTLEDILAKVLAPDRLTPSSLAFSQPRSRLQW